MHKILFVMGAGLLVIACSDTSANSGTGGEHASTTTASGTSGPGATSGSTNSTGASSSTGGGSGSGGAPAGCASYKFCEDFETGNVGETPPGWTVHDGWDQSGSRAVLSTENKHGGSQSLKGAVGTNGQFRVEHDLSSLAGLATHHWGRIFYKVKTPVALDGQYVHNTFVAFGRPNAANGSESRVVDTVVDPQGKHQFLFNVPDDTCCAGSSYDYAYEGGWHCAEWYVDGATESFRFFADGSEVQDISFMGAAGAHIADFTSIIVGWINYQSPTTPNEGWFDDLALDDQRIGCN